MSLLYAHRWLGHYIIKEVVIILSKSKILYATRAKNQAKLQDLLSVG